MDGDPTAKRMRLRYAGTCSECTATLPAGTQAIYDRVTRSVRCLTHDDPPATLGPVEAEAPPSTPLEEPTPDPSPAELDCGTPGASARREYERRRTKREDDVRGRHPKLGGLILALSDERRTTRVWDTGALGEEALGSRLNELAGDRLKVLHDRRIPRTRANIDHLAVTPTGIWVIDAKRYKGKRPALKVEGGILRPRVEKLMVGGRDSTKLIDGMTHQVEVVRGIVGDEVPVRGVLCFLEADWPLLEGSFETRSVHVVWPRRLYKWLRQDGPLEPPEIAQRHRALAERLASA
ncbi:nuclease-related domain-containing protein [Nocardioides marmoribigeumensis]|uniref:NERD domain-containing protein n=1 Tax=Nocardioides marmoribigeumensis TaxID=433649 RepID=A0ABU2BUD3_9ACTN|nr:nuclease-related domain-containing protein [Nocardioides marmoribigeumensis]MDR7361363.1 hypothetical protein [Nocardioides marmoribigeumensis]